MPSIRVRHATPDDEQNPEHWREQAATSSFLEYGYAGGVTAWTASPRCLRILNDAWRSTGFAGTWTVPHRDSRQDLDHSGCTVLHGKKLHCHQYRRACRIA
jgi:hypothetical protein